MSLDKEQFKIARDRKHGISIATEPYKLEQQASVENTR